MFLFKRALAQQNVPKRCGTVPGNIKEGKSIESIDTLKKYCDKVLYQKVLQYYMIFCPSPRYLQAKSQS